MKCAFAAYIYSVAAVAKVPIVHLHAHSRSIKACFSRSFCLIQEINNMHKVEMKTMRWYENNGQAIGPQDNQAATSAH